MQRGHTDCVMPGVIESRYGGKLPSKETNGKRLKSKASSGEKDNKTYSHEVYRNESEGAGVRGEKALIG